MALGCSRLACSPPALPPTHPRPPTRLPLTEKSLHPPGRAAMPCVRLHNAALITGAPILGWLHRMQPSVYPGRCLHLSLYYLVLPVETAPDLLTYPSTRQPVCLFAGLTPILLPSLAARPSGRCRRPPFLASQSCLLCYARGGHRNTTHPPVPERPPQFPLLSLTLSRLSPRLPAPRRALPPVCQCVPPRVDPPTVKLHPLTYWSSQQCQVAGAKQRHNSATADMPAVLLWCDAVGLLPATCVINLLNGRRNTECCCRI